MLAYSRSASRTVHIRNIVSPEVFPAGRGRFPQPEERPPWPPLLHDFKLVNNGAERGGRTPMTRRSADFESLPKAQDIEKRATSSPRNPGLWSGSGIVQA